NCAALRRCSRLTLKHTPGAGRSCHCARHKKVLKRRRPPGHGAGTAGSSIRLSMTTTVLQALQNTELFHDLSAFRTGADGREQIIHVERSGATIGELPLFDGEPYPSTVAAEEDSVVIFLDRQTVLNMCHAHPEIAMAALRVLSRRLRKCAALVETLSLRAVGQRLAVSFLNEAKACGQKSNAVEFELSISKEQLAARIGSVREVVSRAMSRLDEQGLIRIDAQRIHIPDIRRLRHYAEEE